jgi:hypothetical protein
MDNISIPNPPLAYPVTIPNSVVVFSASEVGNAIPPALLPLDRLLAEPDPLSDPDEAPGAGAAGDVLERPACGCLLGIGITPLPALPPLSFELVLSLAVIVASC